MSTIVQPRGRQGFPRLGGLPIAWKWHFLVAFLITVGLQWPLWVQGIGEEVLGTVTDAYVDTPTSGRMKVPYVVLEFSFPWQGKFYRGRGLYDPRKSLSTNWGDEERRAAAEFIANHPKGRSIAVWAPRYALQEASPIPPLTSMGWRHLGRWILNFFLLAFYVLIVGLAGAAYGGLRRYRRKRLADKG